MITFLVLLILVGVFYIMEICALQKKLLNIPIIKVFVLISLIVSCWGHIFLSLANKLKKFFIGKT